MLQLSSLIGKDIITADAYNIGEINDVRYDPFEWNVVGLRIKAKHTEKFAAGHGKANLLVLPNKFVVNDVLLMSQPIDGIKDSVSRDNENISSLSTLMSAKVVTRDNALVGVVTTVVIDESTWKVSSIIVRLDKTAIEAMKMKKGFFEKINVEIRTNMILSSKDMVHLNEQMSGVRENMTVLE